MHFYVICMHNPSTHLHNLVTGLYFYLHCIVHCAMLICAFSRPGEFRGSCGLHGCRGHTKNPPNTKSVEFTLTLGENEFCGLCGFQSEILSVEFVMRGRQQCSSSFSTHTAVERF